ncbi:MAG: WD40/YVTN/BNR-like repeat-containing protein [Acidimicrobiales bacterium]
MPRQSQLRLAATAVVLFAFLAIGRSSPLPAAGAAQSATPVGGAADLLSTTQGVVWSFNIENGSGVVLRSADDGSHWRVVLSELASQVSFGLVASYFLGPEDAWAVSEEQTGATSVYRTSDGGRHWYLSDLPIVAPPPNMPLLSDQLYFADPEHGWLLAVGTNFSPPTNSLTMVWWRTDNGGRTWSQLPPTSLPPQAVALPAYGDNACPEFSPPHIAFATANIGWWTYGACGTGAARPLVWRTRDGGRNWTSSPLSAPPGGWGSWDVLDQGGTDVGAPYLIPTRTGTTIVVPVSVGRSRLVVERSRDMGRTWRVAGMDDTHALPIQSTPADWFDPVNASDWVVAAPGGLIETTNAGETWTLTRSPIAVSGQPVSFTSPVDGFVQGSGLVIAMRTSDRDVTWNSESASISRAEQAVWAPPSNAVSTVQVVSSQLAVAAGAIGVRTSSNDGHSWVDRLGTNSTAADLDFINSRVGFAVDNGELVRTMNGGVSWQALLHPVAGGVSGIEFWSPSTGLVSVGSQSLFITSDGGTSWRPLRLPPGWIAFDAFIGGDEPTGICFTNKGVGWAVGSRAHRFAVFVSTSNGRSWRLALSSVLPPGAEPAKLGGGVSIAGCDGKAAWVLVSQAAGPMDMQGVPTTFDLLRSLDLGRSWLDVLRSTSFIRVTRPKVPTFPGGPESVPFESGPWALALASPATAWFTATNEDLGSITFGSTRDGGVHWKIHSSSGAQDQRGSVAASQQLPYAYRWLETAALNAADAWVLFRAPEGSSESYLYATSNGGAAWHRLAVFR